ncbi:MAG: hypothetical protein A2W31_18760 [Planctomycetes bacterium RBG_16_64_10]|nr:MAG: hypothetical protein A2W31_18760 [Planctomycetes bacterium RBG_16_64_10]
MRISAKIHYACIAVLELAAKHDTGTPVQVRKIAHDNGIPSRFLVQILLQLKGAGLVRSVRGAGGGYRLGKAPAEISLAAVMAVIEGPEELASNAEGRSPAASVLMDVWRDLAQRERRALESITLVDLLAQLDARCEPIYDI